MFKWLKDFLGIGPRPEPVREEIIVAAAPIAPTPVVTSIAVQKVEHKPAHVPESVAAVTKAPAKKAAAKAKAPAKKAAPKKSKS